MCLTGRWQWSIGPTWKVLENTPNENTTEHFDWQKPTLNPCRTAVCMPKITFWIRKRKIWVSKKSCLFANLAPNLPCLTGAFSKSARSTPIARSRHIFPTVRIDCYALLQSSMIMARSFTTHLSSFVVHRVRGFGSDRTHGSPVRTRAPDSPNLSNEDTPVAVHFTHREKTTPGESLFRRGRQPTSCSVDSSKSCGSTGWEGPCCLLCWTDTTARAS